VAFRDTEEHRALMDQGQHRAAFHSQQQGQKVWRGAGINAQGGPDARITPGNYSLGSLVPSSGSTNTTSPCFLRRRSSGRESRGVSGIPFTNGSLTLPVGWLAPGSSGAVKGFAGRMASLPHSDHVKYTQHLEHLSKTNGYIDPASNPFAGQPPHLKPPAQQADAGALVVAAEAGQKEFSAGIMAHLDKTKSAARPDSECTRLSTAMALYRQAEEMAANLPAGGDADSNSDARERIEKLRARADKLLGLSE
jgi:hypothetical protein